MKLVYKFGGASVRSASGVRQLSDIVRKVRGENLVIVVSAMGKTTDALERLVHKYFVHKYDLKLDLAALKEYHLGIVRELFWGTGEYRSVEVKIMNLFKEMEGLLRKPPSMNFDFEYDRIVVYGELLSSTIVSSYLNLVGLENKWLDARDLVKTDSSYRSAKVDWFLTRERVREAIDFEQYKIFVTQGFIGSDHNNLSTTLGREGSDFSAAIFGSILGVESVTVWKDVDGVYSGDPKIFDKAIKIERLSYQETIELSYYGAKVIHPRTLRPLQEKDIPLYVRSFKRPELSGTVISRFEFSHEPYVPITIVKTNQILVSVANKSGDFITEESIERIFGILRRWRIRVNVMQVSALKFSFVTDQDLLRTEEMLISLQQEFKVLYNRDLVLYTIRHYTDEEIKKMTADKQVYLFQQSRMNCFILVKEEVQSLSK